MRYTKVPESTFKNLQLNAGILARNFDPATGEVNEEDMVGATSGGVSFETNSEFSDFGEDVDNCPPNVMEFMRRDRRTVLMSGTFVAIGAGLAQDLDGSADIDPDDPTHIIPRNDLYLSDFKDIWWIGDYSDKNGETKGGYVAIHMFNALSTGGFRMQSGNREKGQFEFEFTGHYSINEQDKVPYELYIKTGEDETTEETP